MQVRIEEILDAGLNLTDPVPLSFLGEILPERQDFSVTSAANVALLLKKEQDRVHVKGSAVAPVHATCVRCLKEFDTELKADINVILFKAPLNAPSDEEEAEPDEGEEVFARDDAEDVGAGEFDGKVVEWGDLVREQLLLNLPMQPVCKEDCAGLCATCGINRNEAECACAEQRFDSRWDKLREFKLE